MPTSGNASSNRVTFQVVEYARSSITTMFRCWAARVISKTADQNIGGAYTSILQDPANRVAECGC